MTNQQILDLNTMSVREWYDGTKHLTLGVHACHCAWQKKGYTREVRTCPTCNGNRTVLVRRRNGEYVDKKCKDCRAKGYVCGPWAVCEPCQGSGIIPQNICDTIPQKYVDAMEVKVYREGSHEHITQDHWIDCYSCSDYGRHTDLTDEQLVANVRKSLTHVQATKLARKGKYSDFEFASHIGVFCSTGGYVVRGVWEQSIAAAQ